MQKIILKVNDSNYESLINHLNQTFKSNNSIIYTNTQVNISSINTSKFYTEYVEIDNKNMKKIDDILFPNS